MIKELLVMLTLVCGFEVNEESYKGISMFFNHNFASTRLPANVLAKTLVFNCKDLVAFSEHCRLIA